MKLNELEDFPELGNTIVIDGIDLAKPKREPKFTFDLERMTLALDSPISDVTVEDLMKQVQQAMLEVGNE